MSALTNLLLHALTPPHGLVALSGMLWCAGRVLSGRESIAEASVLSPQIIREFASWERYAWRREQERMTPGHWSWPAVDIPPLPTIFWWAPCTTLPEFMLHPCDGEFRYPGYHRVHARIDLSAGRIERTTFHLPPWGRLWLVLMGRPTQPICQVLYEKKRGGSFFIGALLFDKKGRLVESEVLDAPK